jgi:hypothetical protein
LGDVSSQKTSGCEEEREGKRKGGRELLLTMKDI